MIKAVLIENNQNIINNILNHFQNSPDINFIGAYDDFSKIEESVDLIIFDINKNNFETVLNQIKNFDPETKFIAISDDFDNSLVENTKKYVSDFLFKPIIPAILEASIKKINFKKAEKKESSIKKAKTISIFSLKGGVGKTSLALNLAYEISKNNKNVCLLDFNLSSADCVSFLEVENIKNIEELIEKFQSLNKESALCQIPKYKDSSLYVLSVKGQSGFDFKLNPSKITTIINYLKNLFDYIIIDTYSNYDENNLSILSSCDLILYISLLTKSLISNTLQAIETFSKIGYNQNKIKLIINRFSENCEIKSEEFEKEVKKEIYAKIPNNFLTISDAINQKSPLDITNPQSNIAKAYKNLAQNIINSDIQKENLTQYNHGIYNIIQQRGEE